jgi:ATP-binding cassette, subfamily F, member 3
VDCGGGVDKRSAYPVAARDQSGEKPHARFPASPIGMSAPASGEPPAAFVSGGLGVPVRVNLAAPAGPCVRNPRRGGRRAPARTPARPAVVMAAKRGRRGALQDDPSSNAVDVFASPDIDPDALLAAALGNAENGQQQQPEKMQKPKKEKKLKKLQRLGTDAEADRAVDVFGAVGATQEDLLAAALGDHDTADASSKRTAPKSRDGKKARHPSPRGAVGGDDDDDNDKDNHDDAVVPVGLTDNGGIHAARIQSSQDQAVSLPNAFDHPLSKKEARKKASRNARGPMIADTTLATPTPFVQDVDDDDDDAQHKRKSNSHEMKPQIDRADHRQQKSGESGELEMVGEQVDDDDDEFQPDTDVLAEFEEFSENVLDFTVSGRRKSARDTRSERNVEERRLGDAKRANYGTGGEKFTSVRLEDVTVTFRNTTILKGVTWGVKTGDRVGLVGQNGCGKTTQLRLMAGLLSPTGGEVVRSSARTRCSFLRQEFVDELDPTRTLREEFLSAFTEEQALLNEYRQVEIDIDAAGQDLEKLDVLLNRLEEVRQKCDDRDAWKLDSRVDRVMPGLGFTADDNEKLVASFSGGWKVRIGIGKVLLQDPDLLLLDEPSNHLDLQSVEWLEEYLRNCDLPMVIVSHDREFMNRVCNKIVDIDGGEAFEYPGNYSRFVKLKAERRKAWEAAYERQSKFIHEQQQYIKQNRTSAARSKQVKSREKMLQRMERTGQLVRQPPRGGKPLVFRFPPAPRSGRDVIIVDDVTHGYEDRVLFKDASIAIERGDRMAIIGPNGCGKSTFLRLITGEEEPQNGHIQCRELHNVKLAYFEQNQADALDLTITVLETLKRSAPSDMLYEEIRALLGKFLFKGDSVEKTVESLSGGEKARLALAKMMMEPANVMVLDEPTNHIDAAAMDMLEEALQQYDGTLIVVSHDRYFVSQVASQILVIEDQEFQLHDGDYKSYMEKDKRMKALSEARFVEGTEGIKSAPEVSFDDALEETDKKQKRKKNFGGSGIQSGKTKEMNAKRWS